MDILPYELDLAAAGKRHLHIRLADHEVTYIGARLNALPSN